MLTLVLLKLVVHLLSVISLYQLLASYAVASEAMFVTWNRLFKKKKEKMLSVGESAGGCVSTVPAPEPDKIF